MFSMIINDTSRVIRMTVIGNATTWSITYNCYSDNFRVLIYDHNMFIIQGGMGTKYVLFGGRYKIANNSATTEARVKISSDLES
jgi:hypothetical protein